MTPRLLAHQLLIKAEKGNQYSNIILDNALKDSGLSDADKRLASILFYGVTERKITLDYQISRLSSRPINELDESVINALRLGIYQLAFLDRVPAHAAINETVSLCTRKSSGFVNAILRAYTRGNGILLPAKEDLVSYLSVAYSVCEPTVEKFLSIFGEVETEKLLKAFFGCSDTTVRVNTLKISRDELADKFDGALKTGHSSSGLYASGAIRELYGFDEGLFFVQDQASQICTEVLGAKENDTVIDVCSCPGSKSFGAAIDMNNKGKIYSFDLHENKLSLVRSSAKRLGIDIIETGAHDGRVLIPELVDSADKVICDVPCSGFGVLGKKPELRYKDPELSKNLPTIQGAILGNACKYVKHGGTLVYSTCTVFPEENENVIEAFLFNNPDFSLSEWSVGKIHAPNGMLTLLPHIHGTDGFFIAKLIKK